MRAIDQTWTFPLLFTVALAGCGGNGASGSDDMAPDPCNRGTVESDLTPTPWQGPGVDASGNVKPGQYLVSTTYLRLKPDATAEFMQLLGPIQARLPQQLGRVAVRFGVSQSCGTARTLAVWSDQTSMFQFVGSAEHAAAAAKIGDISRGGSAVTHFSDDGSGATFAHAASELAAVASPF